MYGVYNLDHKVYKTLDSDKLKIIAVISMLIDHIGVVILRRLKFIHRSSAFFSNTDMQCRVVGRLAFPIYCFMLVEGKFYTKNIKKYMLRLGIFALISEIPYDLAFSGRFVDTSRQNVFFTLFIGLAMISLFELYKSSLWKISVYAVCAGISYFIKCDYDIYGITLILVFYILRSETVSKNIVAGAMLLTHHPAALAALVPINMYNGAKGKNSFKYLFYAFYPVHLLILYFIANIFIPLR